MLVAVEWLGGVEVSDEGGRVNMYARSVMERRKAASIIVVKVSNGSDFRYVALDGVVDHTRDAFPSGSGRSAIGPPSAGRNLWYAVILCGSEVKRESISFPGWDSRLNVATTPCRL